MLNAVVLDIEKSVARLADTRTNVYIRPPRVSPKSIYMASQQLLLISSNPSLYISIKSTPSHRHAPGQARLWRLPLPHFPQKNPHPPFFVPPPLRESRSNSDGKPRTCH
jgi:hypothetical protein